MVNECRNPVVRTDGEKLGFKLITAADMHRVHLVIKAALFEHDGYLPSIRRRPVVKINHASPPFTCDK